MNPAEFVRLHQAEWERLEAILARRGTRQTQMAQDPPGAGEIAGVARSGSGDAAAFPALYRRLCQHLALAIERRYPRELVDRLNELALAGQLYLYRPRRRLRQDARAFLAAGFARRVRAHAGLLAIAAGLLYVPLLAGTLLTLHWPELIYSLLSPKEVARFESMYDDGARLIGFERGEAGNLEMFGYYVWNNVGIGFRTFAAGIFLGIGSLFMVGLNGVLMGMLAGYITARGHGDAFWQFVCGHGAFELNAIVLCGMTGLMLGRALIGPGRRSRRDALIVAGREAVPILYGAAAMLLVAAVIEAFWSSRAYVPATAKYTFAALCWLLVLVYFALAGRAEGQDVGTKLRDGEGHDGFDGNGASRSIHPAPESRAKADNDAP